MTEERKPLVYRDGTEMNPDPDQDTLRGVAESLVANHPLAITLQPGDATRYDFVLVPMWPPLMEFGNYGWSDVDSGLVVVRIRGGHASEHGIILLNRGFHEDIPQLAGHNEWSIMLFQWWFALLWDEIQKARRR